MKNTLILLYHITGKVYTGISFLKIGADILRNSWISLNHLSSWKRHDSIYTHLTGCLCWCWLQQPFNLKFIKIEFLIQYVVNPCMYFIPVDMYCAYYVYCNYSNQELKCPLNLIVVKMNQQEVIKLAFTWDMYETIVVDITCLED